ncbi:MAG: hypothetical protein R3C11_06465 [Planctomycetaceae bacterium]
MIKIANETLPQSCLCYLAFRVAFMETLERIALADQIAERNLRQFGYLTEVPFLQAVPPHLQLDLLAETWAKHTSDDPCDASLVDGVESSMRPAKQPHWLSTGILLLWDAT